MWLKEETSGKRSDLRNLIAMPRLRSIQDFGLLVLDMAVADKVLQTVDSSNIYSRSHLHAVSREGLAVILETAARTPKYICCGCRRSLPVVVGELQYLGSLGILCMTKQIGAFDHMKVSSISTGGPIQRRSLLEMSMVLLGLATILSFSSTKYSKSLASVKMEIDNYQPCSTRHLLIPIPMETSKIEWLHRRVLDGDLRVLE